ncbi:AroM family protein [Bordetella genomosp. 10]|nr:AroM family protein [Bordetella genomosp. 10]
MKTASMTTTATTATTETHGRKRLGTLTIGQAPRADIAPILDAALPEGVECLHLGVLDGLSREEIAARYAPRADAPLLVTRLLDGSSVTLDKAAVRRDLDGKLAELQTRGCQVVLILCTGEFHGLDLDPAWLVEPDRIVPPAAAAIAGDRQVGIVVPLPQQAASEAGKFAMLAKPPICEAASPYADGLDALERAAVALRDRGAQVLLLDCMGFTEAHRRAAARASGLPVILSNALIAKLTAELLA